MGGTPLLTWCPLVLPCLPPLPLQKVPWSWPCPPCRVPCLVAALRQGPSTWPTQSFTSQSTGPAFVKRVLADTPRAPATPQGPTGYSLVSTHRLSTPAGPGAGGAAGHPGRGRSREAQLRSPGGLPAASFHPLRGLHRAGSFLSPVPTAGAREPRELGGKRSPGSPDWYCGLRRGPWTWFWGSSEARGRSPRQPRLASSRARPSLLEPPLTGQSCQCSPASAPAPLPVLPRTQAQPGGAGGERQRGTKTSAPGGLRTSGQDLPGAQVPVSRRGGWAATPLPLDTGTLQPTPGALLAILRQCLPHRGQAAQDGKAAGLGRPL
ncbi:uncharacterized protein LOC120890426 [Ictidomys tridecemlineatus]